MFDAVVMYLQQTLGAELKITVEIAAEAEAGFDDADTGVFETRAPAQVSLGVHRFLRGG